MLLTIFTEYNEILKLDDHAFVNKVLRIFIHQGGKGRGEVGHDKIHYTELKRPIAGAKGFLGFFSCDNVDLFLPGGKVNLTEDFCPGQGIK